MAERKKALRGGMDPREMQRRAVAAREARKQAAKDAEKAGAAEALPGDVASLPREKLIQVLQDRTTHPRELVQAAKALAALPADDESTGWRASVQVRPDFEPPSWGEVLLVAKAAGAIEKKS
jgi:hypothetical protein